MKLNITWKIFIGMTLGIIVGYILNQTYQANPESLNSASTYLNLLSKIFDAGKYQIELIQIMCKNR